ncbi:MAG: DUF1800 domain-containing protein [Limnobacter sp.]|nr:DUF1800 domain-containing protein [Limnobacter sp.]
MSYLNLLCAFPFVQRAGKKLCIGFSVFFVWWGTVGSSPNALANTPEPSPPLKSSQQAALFLGRATFGPKPEEVLALKTKGYNTWLNEQFASPLCSHLVIYDRLLAEQGIGVVNGSYQLNARQKNRSDAWWEAAINCKDQLRQRVAYALSQIFVVSEDSTLALRPRGLVAYEDLLLNHAFGNFRDLLEAVATSPAMGEYLSHMDNRKGSADGTRSPDENFAREIMQLFTIGLVELNQDGTPRRDANGREIETYTQEDIASFARVFTGWTCADNSSFQWCVRSTNSEISPMKAFAQEHDQDQKVLLNGTVLPAGQSPQQDLDGALNNLFNHANVGPFIGKQLIQRLVTSNPSRAYVARVAAVFNNNGAGQRGDLKAVVKAILLDNEAIAHTMPGYACTEPCTFGKLKEPVLKLTALWRAFGARGISGRLRYDDAQTELGQQALKSPSVFNFYRPNHTEAALAQNGLACPECQIVNDDTVVTTQNRLRSYIYEMSAGANRRDQSRHTVLMDFDNGRTLAKPLPHWLSL